MRPPALATQQAKRRTASGFSLIELLIVVAIILIIAAIAIPNFMRSRMAANEAAAVAACKKITTAQVIYSTTYARGYSMLLSDLKPPVGPLPDANNAGLLDEVLTSGVKHGYQFFYTPIDADGDGQPEAFTIVANPVVMGSSGSRGFYTDQTGVVRQKINGVAGPADPPIG